MVQRKDYDNLSHLNFNWIKHSNLFRHAISTWEYSHYNLLEMKDLSPTKEEFGREKFDSPSSHSATSFPRSLVLVHSLPQYLTFTHFARAYFFNFYERRQVKIPAGEMLTMKRLANRIPRIRDAGRATRRDATRRDGGMRRSMKRDAFDRVQRLAGFRRLGWMTGGWGW